MPAFVPRLLWESAAHRRSYVVTCRLCRHSAIIDAASLWWFAERKGIAGRAEDVIGRYLYCERCLKRRGKKVKNADWRLSHETPTAHPFPPPPPDKWKALARRLRG